MVPLLASGQRLLVGRLPYILGRPAQGDIVVVRHPRRPELLLVKQIVGLPGDDVPAARRGAAGRADDRASRLGPREYFVASPSGEDSSSFGPVSKEAIIGKAWFSHWPPVRWGVLARSRIPPDAAAARRA